MKGPEPHSAHQTTVPHRLLVLRLLFSFSGSRRTKRSPVNISTCLQVHPSTPLATHSVLRLSVPLAVETAVGQDQKVPQWRLAPWKGKNLGTANCTLLIWIICKPLCSSISLLPVLDAMETRPSDLGRRFSTALAAQTLRPSSCSKLRHPPRVWSWQLANVNLLE